MLCCFLRRSSPCRQRSCCFRRITMSTSAPAQIVKPKHLKAHWDAVAHHVFLDVCIEEVLANNRPVQVLTRLGYENLVNKFNERTKRNYDQRQMKNRWEALKKEYTVWKGLCQHASGLGRDHVNHTIDAYDDWWEKEIQMCPEAAKFRTAPLQDEDDYRILFDKNVVTNSEARVPPSSSRINNTVDVEDSGFEAEDDPLVTLVRAHGKRKRACPYSPSPSATPKTNSSSALDHMVEMMEARQKERSRFLMMEEEKSKASVTVTSPAKAKESSRDEIRQLVSIVYEDGAVPGSLEYFWATQLFLLQEYHEMFACLVEDATPSQRIEWIKMTWAEYKSKK